MRASILPISVANDVLTKSFNCSKYTVTNVSAIFWARCGSGSETMMVTTSVDGDCSTARA